MNETKLLPPERELEYKAAMNIAIYLSQNFYPTQSWIPEPTLAAVLSQIDNMIAGLPRTPAPTDPKWDKSGLKEAC